MKKFTFISTRTSFLLNINLFGFMFVAIKNYNQYKLVISNPKMFKSVSF